MKSILVIDDIGWRYIDNIKNFWGEQEIKLVRFELENDQNYYAKVPRISNVKNMYEVHILDER